MFLIYVFLGYCAFLMFGPDMRSYAISCPSNTQVQDGECVLCDGPCPKTCPGGTIHSGNIDSFEGCTIIDGYLKILDVSFIGFQEDGINATLGTHKMHPRRLEVFSTLKEITHYFNIQAEHPGFKSLSYFRNLEIIHGRVLSTQYSSLYIVRTSLISLELKSLKKINRGKVVLLDNERLCFGEGIKWLEFMRNHANLTMIARNSDPKYCARYELICDEQCDEMGCWGTGSNQCLSCAHFKLGNKCLQNCDVEPGLYQADSHECKPCYEQCGSCVGPKPDNCTTCKHYKDGSICVEKCPTGKYLVENNTICKPCDSACFDSCTGPHNTVGPGGCTSCKLALMNENATVNCLDPNNSCPDGYYIEWVGVQVQEKSPLESFSGSAICKKCHPRCKKCTGYGFHTHDCQECTYFKKEEHCEDQCTLDYYPDNATKDCIACDTECKGCTGPGPHSCVECENIKLYDDGLIDLSNTFRCVSTCPPEFPHKISPESAGSYCSDKPASSLLVLVTYIVGGIAVSVISVGTLVYWHRVTKIKSSAIKMAMAMDLQTINDYDQLEPSNALPNIAHLRIITDTEIQIGSILGHGAFGVVYKGEWTVDGEHEVKIPVAIKVLRSATTNNNKEFLSEAYIMASVDHPNVLKLLAVCMTSEMMLITELMPLGSLLNFVKKHRDRLGSKTLLNWCAQIANGMAYLGKDCSTKNGYNLMTAVKVPGAIPLFLTVQEKRFVHRDLAARNVLVQRLSCVKITDFGLARPLDNNEEKYQAEGGLMPIKWLALECIQHGIYTHKTDVWAFGVTVWELLTFGQSPYDSVCGWDVQKLLEKGKRLPQPNIATIHVYWIMLKCWIVDADSRPGFIELEKEFAKMAKNPGQYLTIPGGLNKRVTNKDMIQSLASENMEISEAYDYIYKSQPGETFPDTSLSATTPSSPTSDEYVHALQSNPKLLGCKDRLCDRSIPDTSSSISSITIGDYLQNQRTNVDYEKPQQVDMKLQVDAKNNYYYGILSRKIERKNSIF